MKPAIILIIGIVLAFGLTWAAEEELLTDVAEELEPIEQECCPCYE